MSSQRTVERLFFSGDVGSVPPFGDDPFEVSTTDLIEQLHAVAFHMLRHGTRPRLFIVR
jgi:hypothetical protein